jgi:hypothetical protein
MAVVLSYQGEEIESRCATVCLVDKKRYKFTEEHAVRDVAPACFGGTYRDSSCLLEILQLSFFLHNSNFFRQPSSLRVQRREQLTAKL